MFGSPLFSGGNPPGGGGKLRSPPGGGGKLRSPPRWRLWRRVVHAPVELEAEAGVVHAPVQVEAEAEVEAKLRDLLHRFPVAEADQLPEAAHQAL